MLEMTFFIKYVCFNSSINRLLRTVFYCLYAGAHKPFEAIFIQHSDSTPEETCKKSKVDGVCTPLVLILHGGPHSVSLTSYSKSLAFLSTLGYNLLLVNYR